MIRAPPRAACQWLTVPALLIRSCCSFRVDGAAAAAFPSQRATDPLPDLPPSELEADLERTQTSGSVSFYPTKAIERALQQGLRAGRISRTFGACGVPGAGRLRCGYEGGRFRVGARRRSSAPALLPALVGREPSCDPPTLLLSGFLDCRPAPQYAR